MTILEAYVLFGIPAVLLGMGVLVYVLTGWADRHSRRHS